MDPSLRLSCQELLELPYFQEDAGANWGRDSERVGRRHEKGSRRRQAGVSKNSVNNYITLDLGDFALCHRHMALSWSVNLMGLAGILPLSQKEKQKTSSVGEGSSTFVADNNDMTLFYCFKFFKQGFSHSTTAIP